MLKYSIPIIYKTNEKINEKRGWGKKMQLLITLSSLRNDVMISSKHNLGKKSHTTGKNHASKTPWSS